MYGEYKAKTEIRLVVDMLLSIFIINYNELMNILEGTISFRQFTIDQFLIELSALAGALSTVM